MLVAVPFLPGGDEMVSTSVNGYSNSFRLLIRAIGHSLDFGRESAQSQAYNDIHTHRCYEPDLFRDVIKSLSLNHQLLRGDARICISTLQASNILRHHACVARYSFWDSHLSANMVDLHTFPRIPVRSGAVLGLRRSTRPNAAGREQRGRVVRATRWRGVADVADVAPVVPAYSVREICRASAFLCLGIADSFSTTTQKACILRNPML